VPVQPPSDLSYQSIVPVSDAVGILPVSGGRVSPVTVIGTEAIRATFDPVCLQQAINCRLAPGVTDVVINPDAHLGYGAPIGCVMASPTHIYPGPVGVDIKCSMSLLQTDLPAEMVEDRRVRRALIDAVLERIPTGAGKGQRHVPKSRRVSAELGRRAVVEGASPAVLAELGIDAAWADRCEDSAHAGHCGGRASLEERFERLVSGQGALKHFATKAEQLGSYGGGNHFGECEVVSVADGERAAAAARAFGLRDGHVAFLSHCGSRGFGATLAEGQFRGLREHFERWNIGLPGDDRQMVYAPLGTPEADAYLDDMALGANFATVNHLLINALVLEAFASVFPGVQGGLVYFISHNIARQEVYNNAKTWVHRKGATRAFPAGHLALRGTPFETVGHPILLPGNPTGGSAVMVAEAGAARACYSVNHGAGRVLGRRNAARTLDQAQIDRQLLEADVLTNCRQYPIDEAPAVYKDFDAVLDSVKQAGLASEVARLRARFVIKDADKADD
jgi:tRNA-splicing ligase RtcB